MGSVVVIEKARQCSKVVTERRKLVNADGKVGDYFGRSVSVSEKKFFTWNNMEDKCSVPESKNFYWPLRVKGCSNVN